MAPCGCKLVATLDTDRKKNLRHAASDPYDVQYKAAPPWRSCNRLSQAYLRKNYNNVQKLGVKFAFPFFETVQFLNRGNARVSLSHRIHRLRKDFPLNKYLLRIENRPQE